eukprot:TRINITY_DN57242_c0_g1_i1.p1 TRINITY_DN57242_c0_g1~~TRINITY_DN57242_c0_g1_i1.p1  ORF type:complete len:243 (-),score=44.29 TRINITY_DN57242_c0_g1_i1:423-1151(-)
MLNPEDEEFAEADALLDIQGANGSGNVSGLRWEAPQTVNVGDDGLPCELRLSALHSNHVGGVFWPCGRAFARHIARGKCPWLAGSRCIELGAGTGLVGLTAAKAGGASSMLLTDVAELVPLLKHNVEVNGLAERCQADTLDWEAPLAQNLGNFDVVLACEVVYGSPSELEYGVAADHSFLLKTICALCPEGSTTLLAFAFQPRSHADDTYIQDELLPLFAMQVEAHDLDGAGFLYVGQRRSG